MMCSVKYHQNLVWIVGEEDARHWRGLTETLSCLVLLTLHIISVVLGCGLEQGYDLRVVPLLCDH